MTSMRKRKRVNATVNIAIENSLLEKEAGDRGSILTEDLLLKVRFMEGC